MKTIFKINVKIPNRNDIKLFPLRLKHSFKAISYIKKLKEIIFKHNKGLTNTNFGFYVIQNPKEIYHYFLFRPWIIFSFLKVYEKITSYNLMISEKSQFERSRDPETGELCQLSFIVILSLTNVNDILEVNKEIDKWYSDNEEIYNMLTSDFYYTISSN